MVRHIASAPTEDNCLYALEVKYNCFDSADHDFTGDTTPQVTPRKGRTAETEQICNALHTETASQRPHP